MIAIPPVAGCQTFGFGSGSGFGSVQSAQAAEDTGKSKTAEVKNDQSEEVVDAVEKEPVDDNPVNTQTAENTAANSEEAADAATPGEKRKRSRLASFFRKREKKPEVEAVAAAEPVVEETAKVETVAEVKELPKPKPNAEPKKEEIQVADAGGSAVGAATGSAMRETIFADTAGSRVVKLVRTYDSYRKDLEAISDASFKNRNNISKAHQRLSKYDHKELAQAWVAYNSAVAAYTPAFYSEVIRGVDKRGAKRYLGKIHYESVMKLRSSGQAARSVVNNVTAETTQLLEMGAAFKKVTGDIQLKRKITTDPLASRATTNKFLGSGTGGKLVLASKQKRLTLTDPKLDPNARPMLGQMLTIGAHMTVNKTDGKYSQKVNQMVTNHRGEKCLKWAKLNLAQCIAVARDQSEEAYCTGKHAMNDAAACWSFMTLNGGST